MKNAFFRAFALCMAFVFAFGLVPMADTADVTLQNDAVHAVSDDSQTPPLGHRVLNYTFVDNDKTMTDEELFGKFDAESGEWIIESKFDYDAFPNMARVKQAAMEASSDGDYTQAKIEFKEYYKEKKRSFNISAPQNSVADDLAAKLHSEQMYFGQGTTLLNIVSIENEDTLVEVDITDKVNSAKSTDTKTVALVVMGLRKDGSSAEFYSRESGANGPSIDVRLATGATMSFPAYKDTYVSAGDNRNTAYGTETVLKAEESKSSIGVTERVDTNTKRTSIVFQLDSLSEDDDVTSATLKLRGRNAAGTGKMYIALFLTNTASWTEETVWTNYPNGHIAFSYYGEEYQLNHKMLSKNADIYPNANFRYTEDICRTMFYTPFYNRYYYTKDEFYAQGYIKTVGDFMLQHPGGAAINKTLDLANRKLFATQLPVIIDSPYATPEWVAAVAKHVWGAANYMKTRFTSDSNWGTAEAGQLYAIGAYFPEFKDAYDWTTNMNTSGNLKSAAYRVKYLLDNNIRSDFSCYEHAGAYVNYFISTITSIMNIGEVTGVPFILDDESTEKMINVMKYLADISGPGFTFTQWGDEGNYTGKHAQLEVVGRRFGDQQLIYAGTDGKEGEVPSYTSVFYPQGKMAAMRTGWDKRSYMLFTDFGGRSVHGHNDDLSILLFAKGNYLLTDQSMADYNSENDTILQQLEAHNVVITDGQEQLSKTSDSEEKTGAVSGKTNDWVTNESFDFLAGTVKDTGANSWKRNIMFVRGKYWIVTDYMTPSDPSADTEHRQLWHMLSTANPVIDEDTKVLRSQFDDVNIRVIPLDPQNLDAAIRSDGLQGGSSVKNASYGVYTKRARGVTSFNTLLRPEESGEDAEITVSEINLPDVTSDGADAMTIQISATEGSIRKETEAIYYIVNDELQMMRRQIGDLVYDGKLLFRENDKDGNYASLNIYQGSELSDTTGKVFFKYNDTINDFAVEFGGESIYMTSSLAHDSINWDELTFAKQGTIKAVYYNGDRVDFKQTGSYIYFGDEPIVLDFSGDSSDTTPAPAPDVSEPVHGVVGGSSGGGGGVVVPPATGSDVLANSSIQLSKDNTIGYITGYDNGTIRPDDAITREEVVTALYRLVENKAQTEGTIGFSDVSADSYSYEAISFMLENKIISGYEDGTFRPKNQITRGEFAKIIASLVSSDTNSTSLCPCTDIAGSWAKKYIEKMYRAGWITGYPDGTFRPDEYITRAEFMVIVNRVLDRKADLSKAETYQNHFTDISSEHWAFADVIEATVSGN